MTDCSTLVVCPDWVIEDQMILFEFGFQTSFCRPKPLPFSSLTCRLGNHGFVLPWMTWGQFHHGVLRLIIMLVWLAINANPLSWSHATWIFALSAWPLKGVQCISTNYGCLPFLTWSAMYFSYQFFHLLVQNLAVCLGCYIFASVYWSSITIIAFSIANPITSVRVESLRLYIGNDYNRTSIYKSLCCVFLTQIVQLERTSPEQTPAYWEAEKIVNCDSVQYIPSNGTPSHKVLVLSFFNYIN